MMTKKTIYKSETRTLIGRLRGRASTLMAASAITSVILQAPSIKPNVPTPMNNNALMVYATEDASKGCITGINIDYNNGRAAIPSKTDRIMLGVTGHTVKGVDYTFHETAVFTKNGQTVILPMRLVDVTAIDVVQPDLALLKGKLRISFTNVPGAC